MTPKLHTLTISRDPEPVPADVYDALFSENLELHERLDRLEREQEKFRQTVMVELNRLRNALG